MKRANISWQQGQPVSDQFDDVYFSSSGGVAETEYVFLAQNNLPELWQGKARFVIAETGFGTGLNFLTTVMHWLKSSTPTSKLHFISVEKYPLSKNDVSKALSVWPEMRDLMDALLAVYPPPISGFHQRWLFEGRVCLHLLQGDVLTMLSQLQASVDVWFLDGFAPDKNPDMWSSLVFKQMARLSHVNSRFSTYTAAGFVRRGLQEVGFEVKKVKGFARKREMLSGCMTEIKAEKNPFPWFKLQKNKTTVKRVAVIGAGIAGISTACALSKQGMQVDLFEKHSCIAAEASGNEGAVVLPRLGLQDLSDTQFYKQAYVHALHELNQLCLINTDFGWQQSGVIQLPSSPRIKKQLSQIESFVGLAERLEAEQASRLCGLTIKQPVMYYPDAAYLSPILLAQALLDSAKSNIKLHCNRQIKNLEYNNAEWHLYDDANNSVFKADAVVLANATAVNDFHQTNWLNVQSVKGQVSYVPGNERSRGLSMPVCYKGYVIPETNSQHLIGASFSPNDASTNLNIEDHKNNLDDLKTWFADVFELDAQKMDGRAAVRAVSQDRMPLVGPVADYDYYQKVYHDLNKGKEPGRYPAAEYHPGLYVNVAHGSRGMCSAFLCAELIASQLSAGVLPVSEKVMHALHPSRLIIRQLKKSNNNTP